MRIQKSQAIQSLMANFQDQVVESSKAVASLPDDNPANNEVVNHHDDEEEDICSRSAQKMPLFYLFNSLFFSKIHNKQQYLAFSQTPLFDFIVLLYGL